MKSIDLRVIVESPYRPNPHRYDLEMELQENLEYARRCMSHSIGMGESPFLSHLLYTQVLDDKSGKWECSSRGPGTTWPTCAPSIRTRALAKA